jgi:predicted ester cyclase
MGAADVVRAVADAIDAQDWGTARANLAPEFEFTGPVPEPIGRDQWVGLHEMLVSGFPDLKLNLQDLEEDGDTVTAYAHITATNTGELNLPAFGIQGVKATGRAVTMPFEKCVATIRDGKILRLDVDSPPAGGLGGLLGQIGVNLA